MSNLPLEIEYKFLIEMPDLEILEVQPDFKKQKLTQMYLELPNNFSDYGTRCRIRKTESQDKVSYCKTFKKDLTELTRVEIEDEISEQEYTELSVFLRSGTAPVEKTRITFLYEGYTYEVDIFPFWSDKAFMEIEVESESIVPPIPHFIKVIKDVSKDKNYRNSSLAIGIFEGTLA